MSPILFQLRRPGGQLCRTVAPQVTVMRIFGQTRSTTQLVVPNCRVKLFRTRDDAKIGEMFSDVQGNYEFRGVSAIETYYVLAYNVTGPVFGTTVNTLQGS